MVKYKGVSISIITQFDIRKLPEFNYSQSVSCSDPFTDDIHPAANSFIASCYVPIYPGSQIWFEYTIDGPHPPDAAYLFKLLFNNKLVTSWDCTSKSGYHGKMHYILAHCGEDGIDQDIRIRRQAMMFCGDDEQSCRLEDSKRGLIEIRVHRIEHRKRIRDLKEDLEQLEETKIFSSCLELADRGIVEERFPRRRYKYQLLDPVDEPFAIFRFYCRSIEYLESIGLANTSPERSSCSSLGVQGSDRASREVGQSLSVSEKQNTPTSQHKPLSTPTKKSIKLVSSKDEQESDSTATPSPRHNRYLPGSYSEDSLLSITRDSIEDLLSSVPRSPRSSRRLKSVQQEDYTNDTLPPSPTCSLKSPKRRLVKKLTVSLDGVDFDLEKRKRSLSPFTNSGMLRKLVHPVPPSAPAAVTAFGPNINDEVEAQFEKEKRNSNQSEKMVETTTRTERGGNSLMRFLGRRIASHT